MSIDSYRFLDFASRQVMKAWAARQEPAVIPFTPMTKPLAECTVALVSTAGIARNDDVPFDQERERRDPWWGDPSFRVIPLGTTERDVRLYHMHIDPRFGEADLDVVLPMRRLTELSQARVVGRAAPRHYSIMGYVLEPTVLMTSFHAAERTRGAGHRQRMPERRHLLSLPAVSTACHVGTANALQWCYGARHLRCHDSREASSASCRRDDSRPALHVDPRHHD